MSNLPICLFVPLVLAWGLAAAEPTADPLIARVNGVEIHESALAAGLPAGMFGRMRLFARKARLDRMISTVVTRQILVSAGATADPAEIDRRLAAYERRPPTLCSCHVFATFAEFLAYNHFTRDDVRAEIANEAALDALATATWEREHPEPDRAATLERDGAALRASHLHLRALAFLANPGEEIGVGVPRGAAWDRAQAAIARLRAGEDFATIAQDNAGTSIRAQKRAGASDSAVAAAAQNFDGCITRAEAADYGLTAERMATLPAGEVSEPIPGFRRYWVVQWRPLDDAEMLRLLFEPVRKHLQETLIDSALKAKQVEYLGEGKSITTEALNRRR